MSEFVERVVGKAAPPIGFIFCAAMSVDLIVRYAAAMKFGNDFGVYWRTANNPIEMAYMAGWEYPFPYAPPMLLWISPLALIPKWPAYFLFGAVSIAAFVLACRPYLSKIAIALALLAAPFSRGIMTGQVCALMGAAIIWAFGSKNRILAGVALGFVATIKPQLVIMAPLMLALNRDWRAFVSAGAAFLVAIILSVAVLGSGSWVEWIASMDTFRQAVVDVRATKIGITPAMWAFSRELPTLPFLLVGAMAGSMLVYLCRDKDPLERAAAVVAGSLLAAPYALDYDLAALFPFLALSVMRGRIWAALGLVSWFHPLPLAITAVTLLRGSFSKRFVLRRANAV